MSSRDQILGAIRRSLKRGPLEGEAAAALDGRLAAHARNLRPERIAKPQEGLVDLFIEMATSVSASIDRIADLADVPAAVADYLTRENLPARIVASPALAEIPWSERPVLTVRHGPARDSDEVSVTPVLAGVAETGTLALASGAATPSTLNFLPDTHIAVLNAADVVGGYEEVWDKLRARGVMPRTLNYVTGPSRTGDIEQTILLGAHGPRRLHILLVG